MTAIVVGIVVTGLAIPLVGSGGSTWAARCSRLSPRPVPRPPPHGVLDRLVLDSADRALVPAVLCLSAAGLVFGVVYLVALTVCAPSSARSLLRVAATVARRLPTRGLSRPDDDDARDNRGRRGRRRRCVTRVIG